MPTFELGPGPANHPDIVRAAVSALNLFGFNQVFALRAVRRPVRLGAFGGGFASDGGGALPREKGGHHRHGDDEQGQQRVLKHDDRRQRGDQGENDDDVEQDGPQWRV